MQKTPPPTVMTVRQAIKLRTTVKGFFNDPLNTGYGLGMYMSFWDSRPRWHILKLDDV